MGVDKPEDPYESTVVDFKDIKSDLLGGKKDQTIILTVIQGREMDFGKSFSLAKKNIFVGRNKGNDIGINDEKISKIHCEIIVIQNHQIEQIIIRDLNSTNGTYVNGELITQKVLKSGDKIEIGDTVLRLGYDDAVEKEYHTKLFNFAARDSLTGLYNKRYILNELENQSRIARRNARFFSVVIFDLDDFKTINDQYGHLAGDEYLKEVASILNKELREQDISGRIGGEEFLSVLPETELEGAFQLANRVLKKVASYRLYYHGQYIQSTVSAGLAQFNAEQSDILQLLRIADQALYEAKKTGKNKAIKVYSK